MCDPALQQEQQAAKSAEETQAQEQATPEVSVMCYVNQAQEHAKMAVQYLGMAQQYVEQGNKEAAGHKFRMTVDELGASQASIMCANSLMMTAGPPQEPEVKAEGEQTTPAPEPGAEPTGEPGGDVQGE